MNQQSPSTGNLEEVHLQDYLEVLYRRRRSFIVTFAAVLLAVLFYTFFVRPLYEASSTLHIRDEKVRSGLLDELGLTRENPIQAEIEILKSRTIAEEVVRRQHLDWVVGEKSPNLRFRILEFSSTAEKPVFEIRLTGADSYAVRGCDGQPLSGRGESGRRLVCEEVTLLLDQMRGKVGDSFELTLLPFDETVQTLRNQLQASEVGKGTNIIKLGYRNTDPVQARDVVNTLSQVYLERSVANKTEEASKTVEFIQEQLENVRANLDQAEQSLEDYKSEAGVVQLDAEAEKLVQLLTEVEQERAAADLRRQQAQFAITALQKARAANESYTPAVLMDDPVVAGLAQRMAELVVEKRGLSADMKPTNPVIVALSEQMGEIEETLLDTYRSILGGTENRLQVLSGDLRRYEAELRKLPQAELQLARLTRRAAVNADIYTFLLQKHEEARIARASTISNIDVIDPAIAPNTPVKPRKKVNLLLGLLVGGMLGVGLVFFQEYMDDTLKDPEEIKRVLQWPILANIPYLGGKKGEGGVTGLVGHLDPKSSGAEAFRALRTALHYLAPSHKPKVLLITSSFPGEGKTTVSTNLAITLAQAGKKVLLVGCDLRRPTLHQLFGSPRVPGLTEVLIGDATLSEVVHPSGIDGLSFVSAGTTPPNPVELLGSEGMGKFVAELREGYDLVLLDAPPTLPVTDSAVLAGFADAILLVLEFGRVPIRAAQNVCEILQNIGVPVTGLVVNDKTRKQTEYGYYGYYGRYGYYGQEDKGSRGRWWPFRSRRK